MILTEADAVHPLAGAGGGTQLWREEVIPAFRQISSAINQHGARFVAQMNHPGHSTYGGNRPILEPPWSASAIDSPYDVNSDTPREMTLSDIQETVEHFGQAARRLKQSGVNGVEIHSAHDYLIQQFISPKTNKRTDQYGGSEDNRLRFWHEVIDAVRGQVGEEFTVGIRISGEESIEGGYTIEDMERMIRKIVGAHKLDYVSVSGGMSGRHVIVPVNYMPNMFWVPLAARIKQVVDIPILCIGGVTDPVMAEGILMRNEADLVGMTRAQIADPELANKANGGRLDEIRHCIRCNEGCLNHRGLGLGCVMNPRAGREPETELTPAPIKKKVMVVGGGIAGMQATWAAAMRGHQVTLYEKEQRIGGQMETAAKAPSRDEWTEAARYFTRQFELLEVPVRLGVAVDEETVLQENPEALIVATGGEAKWPSIEGLKDGKAEGINVYLARDVVEGKAQVTGDDVVLYALDYGMEGLTCADLLVERGKRVEFITPYPSVGELVERLMMRPAILSRLVNRGVRFSVLTGVRSIREGHIIACSYPPFGDREWPLEGDPKDLVLSAGSKANDSLWQSLQGKVKEAIVVGEANAPRLLYRNSLEGFMAGYRI